MQDHIAGSHDDGSIEVQSMPEGNAVLGASLPLRFLRCENAAATGAAKYPSFPADRGLGTITRSKRGATRFYLLQDVHQRLRALGF